MNKKLAITVAIAAFFLTLSLGLFLKRSGTSRASAASTETPRAETATLIAGPGRVEPGSEDIKIGSELSGRLQSVTVEEGDAVDLL